VAFDLRPAPRPTAVAPDAASTKDTI